MELWDAYDRDGAPLGFDLIRGEPIPEGAYHLCCEALVRHTDGSFLLMRRDLAKKTYAGRFEATAGGAALKGEDPVSCVRRELKEETGLTAKTVTQFSRIVSDRSKVILYSFFCVTDNPKDAVTLQPGETMGFRWLGAQEFADFARSGEMIASQRRRYEPILRQLGVFGTEASAE